MNENGFDFDLWRTTLTEDANMRSKGLLTGLAASIIESTKPPYERSLLPLAKEALSIEAERAYANDEHLFESFVLHCESRGISVFPSMERDLARTVADSHSRLALDEGVMAGGFDDAFRSLLVDALDAIDEPTELSERAGRIERQLAQDVDLWWPEENVIVSSMCWGAYGLPEVVVRRIVSDQAMFDALSRALAEGCEGYSDPEGIRLSDVLEYMDVERVTSTETIDDIAALTRELAKLRGAVVKNVLGSVEECQAAVAAGDVRLLACLGGPGIPQDTVRGWYRSKYPDDELGWDIAPGLTFDDVRAAVPRGEGLYDTLGVGDSAVRERVFEELSTRTGLAYDRIYESWLDMKPLPEMGQRKSGENLSLSETSPAHESATVASRPSCEPRIGDDDAR